MKRSGIGTPSVHVERSFTNLDRIAGDSRNTLEVVAAVAPVTLLREGNEVVHITARENDDAMPAPSVAADAAPEAIPIARLSSEHAVDLAVKLANDECERRYERRPFSPSQYPIEFVGDRFRWGRLDPGGEGGLSAEVVRSDRR
jgi:hypothetical protein